MRLIDIEPFEKEGWLLQKYVPGEYGLAIKFKDTSEIPTVDCWISVKDRMPDEQGTYLVFRKEPYGMITIAWYSGPENGWLALDGGFYADGVLTHYMPLPEPPKEET